jgi:hypothetical protein
MIQAIHRRLMIAVAVLAFLGLTAPAASASLSAQMTLNQSAGTTAGGTANLGLDLKFADTGTDSPRDLTIDLPAGLLANASINGGGCLRTRDVAGAACEIGSGSVTATPDLVGLLNLPLPVSVPVNFYLVPPPAPGDLAGLAVTGLGEQLGATGDIKIRPSGDPAGVGVTISLVLPNQLPLTLQGLPPLNLTPISVTEINSTFDALRYPTACPKTPADLSVTVDSYADPATHSLAAPLRVTDCASLPYAPAFKTTAVRDTGDRQVRLGTTITQTANQATTRSVVLAFPTATFAPNLAAIGSLCLDPGSGSCQAVGSASATSPLYPATLDAKAYLTGSSSGLSLTLVFPAPFPLTLTGAVNLLKDSATFTGLPDIPLTDLTVSLAGGLQGLFLTTCQAPTGTATATLIDQNADRTLTVPSSFTVSGCRSNGSASVPGGARSGTQGHKHKQKHKGKRAKRRGVSLAGASLVERLVFALFSSARR